jgi:hypothetical protein
VNDNRLVAVLALAVLAPGFVWAWRDYREGHVRLMVFSRRRSTVAVSRADDPRRFWAYTAFNLVLCGIVAVFAVLLMFKPEG